MIPKPCKYLKVCCYPELDTQSFISYASTSWTVEKALLFSTELSKNGYKALLLYINPVNSVIDRSWALFICFVCRKYFSCINICDLSLTILCNFWSGVSWPTRNVLWKVFSLLLKRQLAIQLLAATLLANSADLWCSFYCSGLNYYKRKKRGYLLFLVYV